VAAPGAAGLAAAGWLAAALLAGAVAATDPPAGPSAPSGCAVPREAMAERGHTRRVRCDGLGVAPIRGPARLLFGLPIDLNRADATTLAALPGIGAGRAEAIVRSRALRPFRSVPDLARVPGIGGGTITRIAQRVVATPAHPLNSHPNPEKTHGLSPDDR